MISETPQSVVLARYGAVPQVARFVFASDTMLLERGDQIVVSTDRGEELATVLETTQAPQSAIVTGDVQCVADADVLNRAALLSDRASRQFDEWTERIADWQLQLELVDLEWTLDDRLILYVLNARNAETTRLALLTAAKGLGIVHVQPVAADGIVAAESSGGCGSGGCGSGGCSTH